MMRAPSEIRFSLVFTTKLQEVDAHTLRPDLRRSSGRTANDSAANPQDTREDVVLLRLGGLGRAVPKRHVAQLMGHHAGHLAFIARRFNHAAVDIHRPAGQGEAR